MEVDLVGQSAQNQRNIQANTCRLVNCFRQPAGSGARTGHVILPVLGTQEFADMGRLFIKDMRNIGGTIYVLSGGYLSQVSRAGSVNDISEVAVGDDGFLFGESAQVCAVTGGALHVLGGDAVTTPTIAPFTGEVGSGDYLNGYTIVTEKNGRKFAWSSVLDATAWDGNDFATAEGTEGAILRAVAVNGNLLLMKEQSFEIWYPTGQSGANAFARVQSAVFQTGIKSASLLATVRNALFYVGSDNIAYISDGKTPQPISTPAVNTSLTHSEPLACFAYEQEGQKFFAITFRDRPAWVFDIATREWHERASGADFLPWLVKSATEMGGEWFVAFDGGEVCRLVADTKDHDGPLVRELTTSTITQGGDRFRVKSVEVYGRTAPTDQSGVIGDALRVVLFDASTGEERTILDGSEIVAENDEFREVVNTDFGPKVQLSLSGDYGITWSDWIERNAGAPGQYDTRMVWRSMGQFRQVTARVRIADEALVSLNSRGVVEIV